jgi:hypothetical protein
MELRTRQNSTNVRFTLASEGAPALLALALWASFTGLMQWLGALAVLDVEVRWLTAYACAVAALAYAVDEELRRALARNRVFALVLGLAAAIASYWHPVAMLAFAPAAVTCGASLALPRARPVSSAPAASPGARPDAL